MPAERFTARWITFAAITLAVFFLILWRKDVQREHDSTRAELVAKADADLDAYIATMPDSEMARGVAQGKVAALRRSLADKDQCISRYDSDSGAPSEALAKLRQEVQACAKLAAAMSSEIERCATALDGERCGELVRAWHCLHESDCYQEAAESMDILLYEAGH